MNKCPICNGAGQVQFFDEALIVNEEVSLAEGALRYWDKSNTYYFQLITSLARYYGFDVYAPWSELPTQVQAVLLHGSGDEHISFDYQADRGVVQKKHPFAGIIPNLERRLRETPSEAVKRELSQFQSSRPCPVCSKTLTSSSSRVDDQKDVETLGT